MSASYEDLNLPQLLDLLHEPVAPAPIPWLPQTIGWQVVGAWLLVVALMITVDAILKWRRNAYRREALGELRALAGSRRERNIAGEIATLLKRTALAVYPREQVAHLSGEDWAAFLVESARRDGRVRKAARDLAAAAYRPGIRGEDLIAPARRWIRIHRYPDAARGGRRES